MANVSRLITLAFALVVSPSIGCVDRVHPVDVGIPAPTTEIWLEEELRFSASDPAAPLMGHPGRVDVDENGYMYVTDWREYTVWVANVDGQYITKIGQKGDGPGYFVTTPGVTYVDGDSLIVFSAQGLDVFDRNTGEYRRRHAFPQPVAARVWLILARSYPRYTVLLENEVYDVIVDGDSIRKRHSLPPRTNMSYSYNTGFQEMMSLARYPWCSGAATKIYCGYNEDLKFIVLSAATGNTIDTFDVAFEPLKLNSSERSEVANAIKGSQSALGEIPSTWPAFSETLGDDRDRLWITMRTRRNAGETLFWVVDPAAGWSGFATVPGDLYATTVRNGKLYGVLTESSGEMYVVRYRIDELRR